MIRCLSRCAAAALALAGAAGADVDPTAQEMLFVYEVNRARSDPPGWAIEMGIDQTIGGNGSPSDLVGVAPQPPLALNRTLVDSSRFKAQEMADNSYFNHQSQVGAPNGLWPNELVRNLFGYPLTTNFPDNSNQIESIAAGFGSPGGPDDFSLAIRALIPLIVDKGVVTLGHRNHLLAIGAFNQNFVEVGAGYGFNSGSPLHNYWAFHTGVRSTPQTYLTGVVFTDSNGNDLYDAGEGLSGVMVSANAASTATNATGGYSILVTDGSTQVRCSGGGFSGTGSANVVVAGDNRELDCISGVAGAYVDFVLVPEPVAVVGRVAALGALALLACRRRV